MRIVQVSENWCYNNQANHASSGTAGKVYVNSRKGRLTDKSTATTTTTITSDARTDIHGDETCSCCCVPCKSGGIRCGICLQIFDQECSNLTPDIFTTLRKIIDHTGQVLSELP